MNKYEKTIGLKTIWITIIRRWQIFLAVFIPICLISFVVTNFMLVKTYVSTISINRGTGTTISTAQYTEMQSYIVDLTINTSNPEKSGALVLASQKLAKEDIFISSSEIKEGISFATFTNGSSSFSFSFTSSNQSIVQRVLQVVTETAIEKMGDNAGYKNSQIVSPASAPIKNSKERTYFLIALAAGFVVAFGIPFVDEIVSDEVYDKYDIESLGCSAFEVKAKPKKKEA